MGVRLFRLCLSHNDPIILIEQRSAQVANAKIKDLRTELQMEHQKFAAFQKQSQVTVPTVFEQQWQIFA